MLLRFAVIVLVVGLAGLVPVASGDGVLQDIRGRVLVNQGQAFVPVGPGQALAAGDRLLLMPDGKVDLVFSDGCRRRLVGPRMVLVGESSPCLDNTISAGLTPSGSAARPFDGNGFLARTGRLGVVADEDFFDTHGP